MILNSFCFVLWVTSCIRYHVLRQALQVFITVLNSACRAMPRFDSNHVKDMHLFLR